MSPSTIIEYCLSNFSDIILTDSWGETGIFYNPNKILKRGVYVFTIKEKDGANDKSSLLNRDKVFCLNIGLRKETFRKIFGELPSRPSAGNIVEMDYDFTSLNKILPHPVYAWMGWIRILNPTLETYDEIKPFLQEAYEFSKEKFSKRKR